MPKLTPANLAALFWEMDSKEQGLFFDELGTLVMSTPSPYTRAIGSMWGLEVQMAAAANDATALGRDAMERIANMGTRYLNPSKEESARLIAGHPAHEN